MASEYLKWKYRDVKPDAPIELTQEEKRRNWWDYHKWHVVIGIFLCIAAIDIGKDVFQIGTVEPDFQIAYVGTRSLPDDTVTALQDAFASYGEDCNGDGEVIVQLNQYVETSDKDSTENDNVSYAYASQVRLMGDLEDCESYFFILEDGETFQKDYAVLSCLDGSEVPENASSFDNCYIRWRDCPVPSSMDLGTYEESLAGQKINGNSQDLLADLVLARRVFWQDHTVKNKDQCDALWNKLMEGVLP